MGPCDDECGMCDRCVEDLKSRADDQRDDWAIEDMKEERW